MQGFGENVRSAQETLFPPVESATTITLSVLETTEPGDPAHDALSISSVEFLVAD